LSRKRVLRVTEAVKRELGFILDRQVEDPRIGMVTVTRVDLSDDLRHAKVYVSFLGGDEDKALGLKFLKKARGYLRSELAGRLDLRVVPELMFLIDESAENYLRIEKLLKEIHEEEPKGPPDGSEEDPPGS
jgi:ribosome-binding factor A